MKNYIGIDVGGTAVKAGVVNEVGEVVFKETFPAFFDNYKTPLFDTVLKATKATYDNAKKKNIAVEGIGFSITGDVDTKRNFIVDGCGSIPDWTNIDVETRVNETIGEKLPIKIINDANAAAVAERWIGNAKGFDDVIIYTIGTGIGGGIFVNGKILNGSRGFAGNIGHMVIADGQDLCQCGNSGCFERIASTRNLLRKTKELGYDLNGVELFEQAESDKNLQGVLKEFFHYHGVAVGSLIHIFNPEAVVIGGGISNQGQWFVDTIKESASKHTLPHFFKGVEFKQAKLTNDAGLIGAVKNFIDNI